MFFARSHVSKKITASEFRATSVSYIVKYFNFVVCSFELRIFPSVSVDICTSNDKSLATLTGGHSQYFWRKIFPFC